jgi:hypothetical protein
MRSQLFGFVVQTHLTYELLLNCPLNQAATTMIEFLREMNAVIGPRPETSSQLIHYLSDPLTLGFEAFLNEWDEEIVQTVRAVMADHALAPEFLRMKRLEDALSWLWPKLRETTVLGHFVFATTIDNLVLLTISFGWNDGALPEDVASVESFMPLYSHKVEQLGYTCQLLSPLVQLEKPAPEKKYGPRIDTLLSLKNLVEYRRQHLTRKKVEITLKQACQDNNLAMATVKKYAPVLCARWYDHRYEGDVH